MKETDKNSINTKKSDIYEDPRYLNDVKKNEIMIKNEDEEINQLNPMDTLANRKSYKLLFIIFIFFKLVFLVTGYKAKEPVTTSLQKIS
jgi:hypothetical protein